MRLHSTLRELAGGAQELALDGATVGELLRGLEGRYPAVAGWILDERGRIREHVNVFVNGDRSREDAVVAESDRVHVLPSITGG